VARGSGREPLRDVRPDALDGAQIGQRVEGAQRERPAADGARRRFEEAALDRGAVHQQDRAAVEVPRDELDQASRPSPPRCSSGST